MTWGAVAGAAASVVGGMMSGDAAGDAAGAQTAASREATQLQRDMYEQTREDQAGYRRRGDLAGNRLSYLMGLEPGGTGGQTYNKTADQFRQELMGQYGGGGQTYRAPTSTSATGYRAPTGGGGLLGAARAAYEGGARPDPNAQQLLSVIQGQSDSGNVENWGLPGQGMGGQLDEAGLNAAVQQAMAQQERDRAAAEAAAGQDSEYGSMMRNFSATDRDTDPLYAQMSPLIQAAMQRASKFETAPGYEFRKAEGAKGVENSAAARGGLLSGAALKAMERYGQDFASNEYGNWFNQSNTDRNFISGQGDAAYNRYNNNNTQRYNRLAGISGTGQQATNFVNTAGANYANQASQNAIGAGNAQAAGIVGQANALSGGLSGAYNSYQNNQLMNLIRNPGGGQTDYGALNSYRYGTGGSGD